MLFSPDNGKTACKRASFNPPTICHAHGPRGLSYLSQVSDGLLFSSGCRYWRQAGSGRCRRTLAVLPLLFVIPAHPSALWLLLTTSTD